MKLSALKKQKPKLVDSYGRPLQVECSGDEFLQWCKRADAGEVRITIFQRTKTSWILSLNWPQ